MSLFKIAAAALGFVSVALVAALTFAGSAGAGTAPTVRVTSETVAPGTEGTVELSILNVGEPGLGAWSIDLEYDPTVITPTRCEAQHGGVCNPLFTSSSIRVAGASASGLVGNTVIAVITFGCAPSGGESELHPVIADLADATVGGPVQIPAEREGGTFFCKEHVDDETATPRPDTATPEPDATATPTVPPKLPDSGTGGSIGGGGNAGPISWLIAGLAGAGIAWLAASFAQRRFVPDGPPSAPTPQPAPRSDAVSDRGAGWFASARRDLQTHALEHIEPLWRRKRSP
jgi:hypothetical protein